MNRPTFGLAWGCWLKPPQLSDNFCQATFLPSDLSSTHQSISARPAIGPTSWWTKIPSCLWSKQVPPSNGSWTSVTDTRPDPSHRSLPATKSSTTTSTRTSWHSNTAAMILKAKPGFFIMRFTSMLVSGRRGEKFSFRDPRSSWLTSYFRAPVEYPFGPPPQVGTYVKLVVSPTVSYPFPRDSSAFKEAVPVEAVCRAPFRVIQSTHGISLAVSTNENVKADLWT